MGLRFSTAKSFVKHSSRVRNRVVGIATDPCPPRCHLWTRPHGCTPTGMQVVERRREQASEEVLYAARGHAHRTQIAERRRKQAAEYARSRPAKAGIHACMDARLKRARNTAGRIATDPFPFRRHSGESRNPRIKITDWR